MNRKLKVCKLWEIENIQILEKFLIFPHFLTIWTFWKCMYLTFSLIRRLSKCMMIWFVYLTFLKAV